MTAPPGNPCRGREDCLFRQRDVKGVHAEVESLVAQTLVVIALSIG
jgi:hypothetical protein